MGVIGILLIIIGIYTISFLNSHDIFDRLMEENPNITYEGFEKAKKVLVIISIIMILGGIGLMI